MSDHRTRTPALGAAVVEIVKELDPPDTGKHQAAITMVTELVERAAERSVEAAALKDADRRKEVANWTRWAITIAITFTVTILGAWWGLGKMFDERVTRAELKDTVTTLETHHVQHPDSKVQINEQRQMLLNQQRQLDRIEGGIEAIKETIADLKRRPK